MLREFARLHVFTVRTLFEHLFVCSVLASYWSEMIKFRIFGPHVCGLPQFETPIRCFHMNLYDRMLRPKKKKHLCTFVSIQAGRKFSIPQPTLTSGSKQLIMPFIPRVLSRKGQKGYGKVKGDIWSLLIG